MGTLSVNGTDYSDLGQAFLTNAGVLTGDYYMLPPWGDPPKLSNEENDIMIVGFPGVDGVWRKNLGFRGRAIQITMGCIGDDKSDVWSRVSDLFDHFSQFERFTITLPDGINLDGCALIPGGSQTLDEFAVGTDVGAKILVITHHQFKQYSYANA